MRCRIFHRFIITFGEQNVKILLILIMFMVRYNLCVFKQLFLKDFSGIFQIFVTFYFVCANIDSRMPLLNKFWERDL